VTETIVDDRCMEARVRGWRTKWNLRKPNPASCFVTASGPTARASAAGELKHEDWPAHARFRLEWEPGATGRLPVVGFEM